MIERTGTRISEAGKGVLGTALRCLRRAFFPLLERRRQRRALADLDARLLRDIGRTREEALREADKPAWRR